MDGPSTSSVIIMFVFSYVVIPIILLYRRGYFINIGRWLKWWNNFLNRKSMYLPKDWVIVKVRPLYKFEKFQIQMIGVDTDTILGIDCLETRYYAIITLNSGKTIKYRLGKKEGCLYFKSTVIHKDNILLRTWQKGNQYYYDIVPINKIK